MSENQKMEKQGLREGPGGHVESKGHKERRPWEAGGMRALSRCLTSASSQVCRLSALDP